MLKTNKYVGMDELIEAGYEIKAGDMFIFRYNSRVKYDVKFVKLVLRNTGSETEHRNGEWVTKHTQSKIPILEFKNGRRFSTMPWQVDKLVTEIIKYTDI